MQSKPQNSSTNDSFLGVTSPLGTDNTLWRRDFITIYKVATLSAINRTTFSHVSYPQSMKEN